MLRFTSRRSYTTFFMLLTVLLGGPASAAQQSADAYIVVDAGSGRVLTAKNPDLQLYPASMTKIMTLYLTFEALSQGRLSLSTPLQVSELAAEQAPSKLGLHPGTSVSTETCILAAVTLSANDCAMVLAENIGGSEDEFARLMTSRAKSLGMANTHWNNPNGLPDPGQLSTARDMAILAEATIQRFPKYYRYFATRSFTYNGITHLNHNHLMSRYAGMDGIKTGFIRASGFNLTASAVRQNHRLIAVVFGGASAVSRDNYMAALLDDGFRRVQGKPVGPELVADGGPPPEKPPELAEMSEAQQEAGLGQVAGVPLAEAGDAVETGEDAPGTPATIVATTLPALPVQASADGGIAIPDRMLQVPDGAQQPQIALAETGPARPMVPVPPVKPSTPGNTQTLNGEGDADIADRPPTHVLRLPANRVSSKTPQHAAARPRWGVQIGTYSSRVVSDAILQKAVARLPGDIRSNARPVSVAIHYRHGKVYRAELTGFDQISAKKACSVLTHCVPLRT